MRNPTTHSITHGVVSMQCWTTGKINLKQGAFWVLYGFLTISTPRTKHSSTMATSINPVSLKEQAITRVTKNTTYHSVNNLVYEYLRLF